MRIKMTGCIGYFILPLLFSCHQAADRPAIYQGKTYTVYPAEVVQGKYKAEAVSPTEIRSDYRSPADTAYSPVIRFKFSINSRDNELPAGREHEVYVRPENGAYTSPVIVFGETEPVANREKSSGSLPPRTSFTVRADMRDMLRSFREKGAYTTPTGDVIYEDDFKGVYIAGSGLPLTWDFENLYSRPGMRLTDPDGDGIYETTILLNPQEKEDGAVEDAVWKLSGDLSAFPAYRSEQPLIDALYNMALDELLTDIRPDGTLRAGAAWDGVWTRDISYSIWLSLAYIAPEAAEKSLRAKVKNDRIVQDTGTGGAWPVSSDRVVWGIAAWELYQVTGSREWLQYAYRVLRNTAADDLYVLRDPQTGLMRGEQSYLDWREQSYPRWMQPVDIYQSLCLGTNVLHCRMYRILAEMASLAGEKPDFYRHQADSIGQAIQRYLWQEKTGYYGQYLYGGIYPLLSPGVDNLGESLSILFGVATPAQSETIVSRVPVTEYGATSIYPQIPDIKPYHNHAVWPFVQAFWNLASAKAGNEASVTCGLGVLYRAAALFATHKELFVASTGDFRGTAVNSDKMLWSLSGNIAMIYRLYFGMEFSEKGILFAPFVPSSIPGKKTITGFKYRDAVLTLEMTGTGRRIRSFSIDGKKQEIPLFPVSGKGAHTITIELDNQEPASGRINMQPVEEMPATTAFVYHMEESELELTNYDPQNTYRVFIDGQETARIRESVYRLPEFNTFTTIAVTAVNPLCLEGFTGRPLQFVLPGSEIIIQAESFATPSGLKYKGYSGSGFVEIGREKNTDLSFTTDVVVPGYYYLDVRYANGSGPINTQNKCAIRSLFANGAWVGPLVMPQRGENEWSNWGFSNPVLIYLQQYGNRLSIRFVTPQDENMNGEINRALVDYVRLRKASDLLGRHPRFRVLFPQEKEESRKNEFKY